MTTFSHLDAQGNARMVDVTAKQETMRTAQARCIIVSSGISLDNDVRNQAIFAGLHAAKRTSLLIPLCHIVPVDETRIDISQVDGVVQVVADVRATWKTGVEMEALVAATTAALTIVAALDDRAVIRDICVWEKTGGKSGPWGYSHVDDGLPDAGERSTPSVTRSP